ncbi:MAG TPA: beta-L-arabinofuranosidase domain-containing protein [Bacteroidales bacterium]|nr:beta-L-arabinofuranosidase domain-containing protein [Bacteroidales bacterium]
MKYSFSLFLAFSLAVNCLAQSVYPGSFDQRMKVTDKVHFKAYAFPMQQVRLLDSPFLDNIQRESAWILQLDVKRLLHSFRNNAGVFSDNEGGYFTMKKLGGWESLDCDLRGHTTGHILSGLAMLYAQTGDERYRLKADSLVQGLAEVQQALGQQGYLSAFPQTLIDRAIEGKRVWAPWYTLHKIYSGLLDQYLYCNNQTALNILNQAASWAYGKLTPLSAEEQAVMLRNEFGGINDTFYNLYAVTGNSEHLKLAEIFYHHAALDPLREKHDELDKKHANTFIPKIIGEARAYELDGDSMHRNVAEFYWKTVVAHHSFATGSNSDKEKFFTPDKLSNHLSGYTGESCNVFNLLKLTRHLFCWNAEPKYADFYERALFNHILGQQDPATGMISYFLPMLPGAHKVYCTPENSFWCCVGTGFENQAKYGEAIYYHDQKGVFVNLLIPSILTWNGFRMRQETKFPDEENTRLTIETTDGSVRSLYLRYPEWAKSVTVTINDKKVVLKATKGNYLTLTRNWRAGDCVEVTYGMQLWLSKTNDNPDVAAVMYGPIVLAGKMGTEGFVGTQPYSDPNKYNDYYTYDYHIPAGFNTKLKLDVNDLERVAGGGLRFQTHDGMTILEPISRIHRERYIIYWNLK